MNTLEKVGQEIAAFILQSPLMACLGYEDNETGRRYAVENLGDIASGVKQAKKELDNQVRALITSHNSRMRVGQAKAIFGAETLPEGDYEQEVAKKAFKVSKGPAMTFLIRLT